MSVLPLIPSPQIAWALPALSTPIFGADCQAPLVPSATRILVLPNSCYWSPGEVNSSNSGPSVVPYGVGVARRIDCKIGVEVFIANVLTQEQIKDKLRASEPLTADGAGR